MMFVNIIESYRDVVAIADKELIGKNFSEGKRQLDIKESFYKGENSELLSEKEVKELIKNFSREDATFNIVGKKSIKCAIEEEIISEESIMTVENVPYSLVLL